MKHVAVTISIKLPLDALAREGLTVADVEEHFDATAKSAFPMIEEMGEGAALKLRVEVVE